MSAQHTPGRLREGKPSDAIVTDATADREHSRPAPGVAYYGGLLVAESMCSEDRRRMIACWNAFDGLGTEQIESMVNVPDFFFKHMDLLAQRDELLAALQLVRMSMGWQALSDESRQVIDAAIAKAVQP